MQRREPVGGVRFLTFSCFKRLPLLGHAKIRDLFAVQLEEVRRKYCLRIFAWVVMPEHVHLLIAPDMEESSIVRPIWDLKRSVAKLVIARWRELDAPILSKIADSRGQACFWLRGGGYDRNIVSSEEFEEKARYIHMNPVKRGLVVKPEDWAWSGAGWRRGDRGGPVSME
jgi:putative transposase